MGLLTMSFADRITQHPVTVTVSGQLVSIDGPRHILQIGLTQWPLVLPDTMRRRPALGQHIRVIAVPAGGRSPRITEVEPLTIATWEPVRYPTI